MQGDGRSDCRSQAIDQDAGNELAPTYGDRWCPARQRALVMLNAAP